jgi:hypothetical protein
MEACNTRKENNRNYFSGLCGEVMFGSTDDLQQYGSFTVQIVPMENEKGRDLVEAGNLCERKNGRPQ